MYINCILYTESTNTIYLTYILENVFEEAADINYLDIGAAVIHTTETWQGLAYINASQDKTCLHYTLYMSHFLMNAKNSENLYCSSSYTGYILGLLIIIRNTCGNNGKFRDILKTLAHTYIHT